MSDYFDEEGEEDAQFDPVTGRKRGNVTSALNKKRLGRHDLDEIFDTFY